jgi:DNA-directed RNA polymerase II subunit RPB7
VCVTTVTHITQGKIRADGSGLATFKVRFGCVTFRPFKGEVLDCIVTSVNKVRRHG